MDVLIRNVEPATLDKIKLWAKKRHRSLQSELKLIVDAAAERREPLSELELIRKIRSSIKTRQTTDSADLLREDRDR